MLLLVFSSFRVASIPWPIFSVTGVWKNKKETKEKQLNIQNHGILYRVSETITLLTCVTLLDGCFEGESTCSSVTSLACVALLNGSFESESTGYFGSESTGYFVSESVWYCVSESTWYCVSESLCLTSESTWYF